MCKCTPTIRTPYCGKGECVWPGSKPEGARSSAPKEDLYGRVVYEDLRAWMADHVLVSVPVETLKRAIYALEHFASDTVAGRNSAHELHELLPGAKEES